MTANANAIKLLGLFRTKSLRLYPVEEAYKSTNNDEERWKMFVDYRIRDWVQGNTNDDDMKGFFCIEKSCEEKPYEYTIRIYEQYLTEQRSQMNIYYGRGGGSRTTAEKPKWVSTGRKVTIQKRGSPAAQKTVFRNSVTKELRVRKATLAKDGTRRFAYVKY